MVPCFPDRRPADPIVISSGGHPATRRVGVSQLIMNVQGPEFCCASAAPSGDSSPNIGTCTPCVDAGLCALARRGSRGDARNSKTGLRTRKRHRSHRRRHLPARLGGVRIWNNHHAHGDADRARRIVRGRSVQLQYPDARIPRGPGHEAIRRAALFTVELTGSGRASASFIGLVDESSPTRRSFSLGSFMQDDFVQPQPVPEPGTLFLVGGAIAALAARRSLRNRRRQRVGRLAE